MEFKIIKNPSKATLDILLHRIHHTEDSMPNHFDAVGLMQGKMIEMIVASDIAEKAVGVTVKDVHGSCPQNMIVLAIFGETSAVEDAMHKIKNEINNPPYAL